MWLESTHHGVDSSWCQDVAFWHRRAAMLLLSYGRPCLTYNRGAILAGTGCARWSRSFWKSTKRPLQRLFVLQVHLASGCLSLLLQSLGTSAKISVDAAHSKTTKLFGKMAWAACLSCVGGVNLVRFCRFFHARDHVDASAAT